ncbi:MAG: SulP family inorganic anion transporter [Candidatus Promineifilaceae bacterium]
MANWRETINNPIQSWLRETPQYLLNPVFLLRNYKLAFLRPDLIAGLTVAIVLLPQAIAYAIIADLPPEVGLYTAIIGTAVAALWGSSVHLSTGPTNAASLLVLSVLAEAVATSAIDPSQFVVAASVMAVLAGVMRFLFGLFRLGTILYFVADSVITGFTAGAGLLIIGFQLRPLLRLNNVARSPSLVETVQQVILNIADTHLPSLYLGIFTVALIFLMKRFTPSLPSALLSMIVSGGVVYLFGLNEIGVSVLNEIPRGFPPFVRLPLFDSELRDAIWAGTMAAAVLGLVEVVSITRSISVRSGQRVDSNQEFIGQGLASIAAGLFGGYTTSGSFTRSAINFDAGAKTRMSGFFTGVWILLATLVFAPTVRYLPRASLAGVLIVTAYGMVDRDEIRRTFQSSVGDSLIMVVTFFAALLRPLEFAVLTGVVISFVRYVYNTSTPNVVTVLPDENFEHFEPIEGVPLCPQIGVLTIQGGLYFGAVHHVEEAIREHIEKHPDQKWLLFRMHRVNHIDMTGVHMFETIVRLYRKRGGDVFMTNMHDPVMDRMQQTGFAHFLGLENYLATETAVAYLFHRVIDPMVCIYSCQERIWKECQSINKSHDPSFVPLLDVVAPRDDVQSISAEELGEMLHKGETPLIIDVRERSEWEADGFIPTSQLIPLPKFLEHKQFNLPADRKIVFISRTGRRSRQLVNQLNDDNGYNLRGGLYGWRALHLPLEHISPEVSSS